MAIVPTASRFQENDTVECSRYPDMTFTIIERKWNQKLRTLGRSTPEFRWKYNCKAGNKKAVWIKEGDLFRSDLSQQSFICENKSDSVFKHIGTRLSQVYWSDDLCIEGMALNRRSSCCRYTTFSDSSISRFTSLTYSSSSRYSSDMVVVSRTLGILSAWEPRRKRSNSFQSQEMSPSRNGNKFRRASKTTWRWLYRSLDKT